MHEFDLIHDYFKPLAKSFPGSLNLSDDAAILTAPAGYELVATTDAISEGVHFIGNESPGLIAQKLLRVNLSDLAAMGAKPYCYLLTVMLPRETKSDWVAAFAEGLRKDQHQFSIHLAGGDTIATRGSLSFSLTALGLVPSGKALRRSTAQAGDIIYVSGTLGDSALGLALLQSAITVAPEHQRYLEQRYFLPEPRIDVGQKLIGLAHAAMDVSDGLLQDLGHICKASSVGATVHRHKLPLSQAADALIQTNDALWDKITGGGDDYELLFTASADEAPAITALSKELSLPITVIGEITAGSGVQLSDESGQAIPAERGYSHF
jgi:thiamine-monophosphate kinase